jgi:PepSY-associated TM region
MTDSSSNDRDAARDSGSGDARPVAPVRRRFINPARRRQVYTLRLFRKLHRKIGAVLFAFFFIVATTGLLLGWKKHTGGIILPKTAKGVSPDLATWLPFDSLHSIALRTLRDSIGADLSPELERIDARPQKGSVKFVFLNHYNEVQLDGTTGAVLQISHRTSDLIENIHDGSILDFLFETEDEQIKLGYITVIGLSLLGLTLSGAWLWYGPKKLRRRLHREDGDHH